MSGGGWIRIPCGQVSGTHIKSRSCAMCQIRYSPYLSGNIGSGHLAYLQTDKWHVE